MPNAKTQALFDMSTPDLEDHLRETQRELLNLRFQYTTREAENYARLRLLKREVARVKTILHERTLFED